jgi:hypothetical protein
MTCGEAFMSHDLKTIVSDGSKAKFSHYRDGNLFYVVRVQDEAYWKVLSSTALRIQRIRVLKSVPWFVKLFIIIAYLQILSPAPYFPLRTVPPLRPVLVLNENDALAVPLVHAGVILYD